MLTISMSAYAGSSLTAAVNTPNPTAAEMANSNDPVAEGGAMRHIVQSGSEPTTADSTPLSRLSKNDALPIKSGTPVRQVAEGQTEMSRTALSRAEEAINVIDTIKIWESAVSAIKWVMDTVTPIASVGPPHNVFVHPSRANVRSSAELLRRSSMEFTLEDPRGVFVILSQHTRQTSFLLTLAPDLAKADSA
jgi:hypothetical protein